MNAQASKAPNGQPEGVVLTISGPSGVGKGTIIEKLLERNQDWIQATSATTRQSRPGEENGQDYYFVSNDEFEEMVANHEFVEHERVYGHRYGTLRSELDKSEAGKVLVIEVDIRGALNVKKIYPQAISIFVSPPDIDELVSRLKNRGTDSYDHLRRRIRAMPMELGHAKEFEYIVENNEIDEAVGAIEAIALAARYRRSMQIGKVEKLRKEVGNLPKEAFSDIKE